MKNLIKYFCCFALLFLLSGRIKAQFPANDSAWVFQNGTGGTLNLSDEFSSTLDTNNSGGKWLNHYGNYFWLKRSPTDSVITSLANGAELDFASNLSRNTFGTGSLKIRADSLGNLSNFMTVSDTGILYYGYSRDSLGVEHPLTFAYTGGALVSQTTGYKFGYVEISAIYPSKKRSMWPAFWLFSAASPPVNPDYLNEVDVAENGSDQSYTGNYVGNNYHISDITSEYDSSATYNVGFNVAVLPSTDSLSGGFHRFALQWDPDHFMYYFDDVATTSVLDTSGHSIPQNGMNLYLNFCVDPWHCYLPSGWYGVNQQSTPPTSWPQYLEIDYVRYWKLKADCSTPVTALCTPAGYDRKVKKSIATDNTCTPTFNPSTWNGSYTLRATDYVLLDAGTVVNPSGTGYFAIDIIGCPQ